MACCLKKNECDLKELTWKCPRADSRFAPSQGETTTLLCNDVSHWLGTSLESALCPDYGILHMILYSYEVLSKKRTAWEEKQQIASFKIIMSMEHIFMFPFNIFQTKMATTIMRYTHENMRTDIQHAGIWVWISNYIPHDSVGCNYLSMPQIYACCAEVSTRSFPIMLTCNLHYEPVQWYDPHWKKLQTIFLSWNV